MSTYPSQDNIPVLIFLDEKIIHHQMHIFTIAIAQLRFEEQHVEVYVSAAQTSECEYNTAF